MELILGYNISLIDATNLLGTGNSHHLIGNFPQTGMFGDSFGNIFYIGYIEYIDEKGVLIHSSI